MSHHRHVRERDAGMTLIELMVAMVLLGTVSALVLAGVIQATRVLTHNDDENRGLSDAKVVLDRLSRDIREASSVTCDGAGSDPNCLAHLQLWIDQNPTDSQLSSDYVQQPGEIVTWKLAMNADGVHRDVWRISGVAPAATTATRQAYSPDRRHTLRVLHRRPRCLGIVVVELPHALAGFDPR